MLNGYTFSELKKGAVENEGNNFNSWTGQGKY